MELIEGNEINDLASILHLVSYFNNSYSIKNILKTQNQTNRFNILNHYEILNNDQTTMSDLEFSNDKLTKSLQKSIYRRLKNGYKIDNLDNLKDRMLLEIKNMCKSYFKRDDIILVITNRKVDELLLSYLYKKDKVISFSTNDRTMFSECENIDNPLNYIINMNNTYIDSDKNIYYVPKLTQKFINELNKNTKFILDIFSDKHNLEGMRVVSLDNFECDDEIDIKIVFKTWCTLLYLNLDCLID